ncbi:hypothetical protein EJB05_52406 [Eragrostis curvula]|uniref:F-box domain-containing protein n=1 Tax=Eragrostis curvula TaxID=38414 RepID=A0A5J9SSW3_9POAL|nr:hypothetical protein EJB05_52406 [Eragrostis curvula]
MVARMDALSSPPPSGSRDWSELPLDALSSVFTKLGTVDILMGAGLVCRSWLKAAKEPDLWRSVHMSHHRLVEVMDGEVLRAMAKVAMDRSAGQLEVFVGKYFVDCELLKYIWDRSPCLKGLGLSYCGCLTNEGLINLFAKSPLLEDLMLMFCKRIGGHDFIEATGKACKQLKRFSLGKEFLDKSWTFSGSKMITDASGITAMHELLSLSLIECHLTNDELVSILDSCPHLELLCLRGCNNIVVNSTLRAKCARIKELTLPNACPAESDREEEF